MRRPILTYLVIVILGVWIYLMVRDVTEGGDIVRAPVVAASALLGFGLALWLVLTLLLLPAMVLTWELIHRSAATSRTARSVLGAASWAGWCLLVAIIMALGSRLVATPDTLAIDLVLFAMAGAGFSLLAFDGHDTRPGIVLTLSAVVVTAFVVLGSIWMAGRWGGAV